MSFSEIGKVIETLGKDRGIDKQIVIKAIEQAFLVTARKKYGIQGEYETRYNEEDGDIEIYQYKNVVEKVRDHIIEIEVSKAKELDEDEIATILSCRSKFILYNYLFIDLCWM